ncbi:hypothetical protein [Halobiforma nitratireducens]|uniref:Uncharacterized protein n=1 Tax=Halobiforma nitratireducens JCM 10879 TaxID=1227454 RepID=M0LZF2_9EURY|nr:hypothetical protein [Halobiforma nitratireducens]EMA38523.1 hypothetical protein C446_09920 [Halobiforma nitratireducens JCM 10879]
MNSGVNVGSTPHTRQEASPPKRSDARCACGATPHGYDDRRNEPACRSCATTRADNPPQYTTPGTRDASDRDRRARSSRPAEPANHEPYSCDAPGCTDWKGVVTPDGSHCRTCAARLECGVALEGDDGDDTADGYNTDHESNTNHGIDTADGTDTHDGDGRRLLDELEPRLATDGGRETTSPATFELTVEYTTMDGRRQRVTYRVTGADGTDDDAGESDDTEDARRITHERRDGEWRETSRLLISNLAVRLHGPAGRSGGYFAGS